MTLNSSSEGILLESGTNEVEFIEFNLGSVSYGINVSKVQRVVALSTVKITAVADASPCVLGMIHIQGQPILLMDLRSALGVGFDAEPADPSRQLILVTTFNQNTTAYLIDGISKIHRTSWENFVPTSNQLSASDEGSFSTGTITLEDNIIVILDLERLMYCYFPESHAKPLSNANVEFKPERQNIKIVYAEDSKTVRSITEEIMRNAGYLNLQSFESGQAAFDYLSSLQTDHSLDTEALVHLVLTDIEMPQMDGLTLCRKVKQELGFAEPPKVIVYSSLINKEMAQKCRSVGADAQLAKPEVDLIVQLIDQLCLQETCTN